MSIDPRQDALCHTVGESACSSPQLIQRQFWERDIDIYCTVVLFKQYTIDILFLVLQQSLLKLELNLQPVFMVFSIPQL